MLIVLNDQVDIANMANIIIKDKFKLPLKLSSFYDLYKKFLKEHGCKWHDVVHLLTVVAEVVFDIDNANDFSTGKVRFIFVYLHSHTLLSSYLMHFSKLLKLCLKFFFFCIDQ